MLAVDGAPASAISMSKMYFCAGLQPVPPYSTGQSGAIQPLSSSRFSQRTWPALSRWPFFDWAMLGPHVVVEGLGDKGADLVAEREVLAAEVQVHRRSAHAVEVFDLRPAGEHARRTSGRRP